MKLPWGKDRFLEVELPAGWDYQGELVPAAVKECADPAAAIRRALRNPARCPPLYGRDLRGHRVTVVIDDATRPTPVSTIFPLVLEELAGGGVRPKDMTVLVASGAHQPMVPEAVWRRLGCDPIPGLSALSHDCRDERALVHLGRSGSGIEVVVNRAVAEADLVVLVGSVEPHPIAGFSGGLKNVVPGCAGEVTIGATHLLVTPEERFGAAGRTRENCATRLAMEECARMVGAGYFMVNTILTTSGGVAGVSCGDPIAGHLEACRLASRVSGIVLDRAGEVLLVGSHPMDADLRQGTKCLGNVLGGMAASGLIVAFVRAHGGVGDMGLPPDCRPLPEARDYVRRYGAGAYVRSRQSRGPLEADEVYMLEFLAEVLRRHDVLVYAPSVPPDTGRRLGLIEIHHSLSGLMQRASELRPDAVAMSLPMGGAAYLSIAGK